MRGRKCHAKAFALRKIRDPSVKYLLQNRIKGSVKDRTTQDYEQERQNKSFQI